MALVLKTNETIADPSGVIPYLEKDPAIVRGVTLGLIDFSNPACLPAGYVAGAALPSGTSYPTLTNGGGAATGAAAAFDAGVTTGGLNGGTTAAPTISLPDANFALPIDGSVTHALVVLWAKLKNSGYPQSQGNPYVLIAGDSGITSNNRGGIKLTLTGAGAVAGVAWDVLGAYAPTTNLNSKIDGSLHQYATEYIKNVSSGIVTINLYVDKTLIGTSTAANPSFGSPSAGKQQLFSSGAFNSAAGIHSGNKIYRYAVHNLSSRPELTAADMLARDWDATIGYVS